MCKYPAFLLVTLAWCLCATSLEGGEDGSTAEKPREIRVQRSRILLEDQRELASGQSGVIAKVRVREGDRVTEGQVLVELDAAIPKAALAVAEKEAENDVDVRFARKAAEVAATEYKLALAANREQEQTFSDIEIEKLRLEKERSALQIEVAEHQLKVARLRQEEAKTVVDSYQITAPIDGLVTRVFQRGGEAVAAGDPLLELKHASTVRIEADLGIEYLADVKPGVAVQVIPTIFPPGYENQEDFPRGKIFFVDVSADLVTRSVRVLAEVENRNGWLIPGLQAELIILPSEEKNGTTVESSEDSTTRPPE